MCVQLLCILCSENVYTAHFKKKLVVKWLNQPIYSHLAALNELFSRHILTAEERSEVAKKGSWSWEYHLTELLLTKSAVVVQEAVHVLKIRGYSVKNKLQSELCYSSTVHLISEWLSNMANGKWRYVMANGVTSYTWATGMLCTYSTD